MKLVGKFTALLFSLLLAAAPLFVLAAGPADNCGSVRACPCSHCHCCVDSSSGSAAEPVAMPVAAIAQVEWLALAASLPNLNVNSGQAPDSPSSPSPLLQHRCSLPLFQRFCALLI